MDVISVATEVADSTLYIYILLFAVSFVSNALPFGGAPYTLIGAFYVDKLGLINVIVVTSLGAASAKVIIYALGFGTRGIIKKNKNYEFFKRIVDRRSFLVALFIAAIIPGLPLDDFLYLWGGAVKGNLLKMIAVTLVAKIIKSSIEIPIEFFTLYAVSKAVSINLLNNIYFEIGSVVSFIIIGIILFMIDWEKTLNRLREIGLWLLRSSSRRSSRSS